MELNVENGYGYDLPSLEFLSVLMIAARLHQTAVLKGSVGLMKQLLVAPACL